MRALFLFLIIVFAATPAPAQGPGVASDRDVPDIARDVLFQVSTIDALLDGVYDGAMPMAEVLAHGDTGIGTLDGLDGELIVIDGKAWVVRPDGRPAPVPGHVTTPFASVTPFEADQTLALGPAVSMAELAAALDAALPTPNLFYAIKAHGEFKAVRTRSVPRQAKPYPPLAEVTAHQTVFELGPVAGTLVGFYCPPYVKGVNVPGWHLHFLSDDRSSGGHVLDVAFDSLTVALDLTGEFFMALPPGDSDFYRSDLSLDRSKALHDVEK